MFWYEKEEDLARELPRLNPASQEACASQLNSFAFLRSLSGQAGIKYGVGRFGVVYEV